MSEQDAVLAVILARGGSKGIPGKNLRTVGGVTLVGRCVGAAKHASCVAQVIVSTDSDEIRAEAQRYGAAIVWRPPELAGDAVSSEAALCHAVRVWHEQSGKTYRAVALLQATSPFTRSADVDAVMAPLLLGEADSSLSVIDDYGYFWSQGDEGWRMEYQVRARRQDRVPWKREAGNVYGVRYDLLLKTGKLFPGQVQAVTIPGDSCFEIDEPRDLLVAEALDKYRRQPDPRAAR